MKSDNGPFIELRPLSLFLGKLYCTSPSVFILLPDFAPESARASVALTWSDDRISASLDFMSSRFGLYKYGFFKL
ncbi:hypothetical protein C4D60_Mb07t16670 [Musa balbisiana]|uniref:Uncharacterized protein n=1 Tax=Musa balbisiana TaxID=52838 RepID=A0A4S8JG25_MUSBA|nr:hypothetical protein C4D60_Mb07t16670 [Musa balbisiana]